MKIQSYRDLDVWQQGMELAKGVYRASRHMPKEEPYGLTSQLRRAVVSVPTNIAEGSGRRTTAELLHFLHISRGSLRELETLLLIAEAEYRLPDAGELLGLCSSVGRLLSGLINSLERKRAV